MHGSQVHEDMEKLVKMIRRESNEFEQVGHSRRAKLEHLFGVLKDMDPCSLAILDTLVERKWVPIVSEFAIYDEWLKIATNVDLIVWDTVRMKGIAVEIKTGHNQQTDYNAHDGLTFMTTKHPSYCIKDTALNRAAIQLLMSLTILAKRYDVSIEEGAVIRTASSSTGKGKDKVINTKLCQIYKIPIWMADKPCQHMLFDRFVSSRIDDVMVNPKISPVEKQAFRQEYLTIPAQHILWEPTFGYWNVTVENNNYKNESYISLENTYHIDKEECVIVFQKAAPKDHSPRLYPALQMSPQSPHNQRRHQEQASPAREMMYWID